MGSGGEAGRGEGKKAVFKWPHHLEVPITPHLEVPPATLGLQDLI